MNDSTQNSKREPVLTPDSNDTGTHARERRPVATPQTADDAPGARSTTPQDDNTSTSASTPDANATAKASDGNSTSGGTEKEAKSGFRPGRFISRLILLGIVPLAAIAAGVWFYVHGGRHVSTENAYVKTNIVAISSDIAGRVVEVFVKDNQPIEKGTVLFRLDDSALKLEVAQAQSELAVLNADVESIRANYREARGEAAEHRARVKFLEREHQRQKRLRDRGIGTEQAYDQARTELEMSVQQTQVYEEKVSRVLTELGGKPDMPSSQHPRYIRAQAAKDVAEDRLRRVEIRAPSNGIVSNMKLQAGEWVEDGVPIFSILQTENLWIEANLKETQLTNIELGQSVEFTVDAYPDYQFTATVEEIAPATGAEFSLLPPQNATGNWVKVVQRIPVILAISPDTQAPALRAGMTASVSIDTNTTRTLPGVIEQFARGLGLPESVLKFMGIVEAPS